MQPDGLFFDINDKSYLFNVKDIRKSIKIVYRSGIIILMIPAFLFLILSLNPVQNFLISRATDYLSRELGAEVKVGRFGINVFLDVIVADVVVYDRQHNSMFEVEKISIDIENLSLKRKILDIEKIKLKRPSIHAMQLDGDTVMNYQFLLDYFRGEPSVEPDTSKWTVFLKNFDMSDAKISYLTSPPSDGKKLNTGHLIISGLNLSLRDISMQGNTLGFYLRNLELKEHKGLEVKKLSGVFLVSPVALQVSALSLHLNDSRIESDIKLEYSDYSDFSQFLSKVRIMADIRQADISTQVLEMITGYKTRLESRVELKGTISGRIDNIRSRNLEIEIPGLLLYKGNVSLVGLPDFKETFMQFGVKEMYANSNAIEALGLTGADDKPLFVLPEIAKTIGEMRVRGVFTGFYNDFVSNATIETPLGRAVTDISLKTQASTGQVSYNGKFEVTRLKVGLITRKPLLFNEITMSAEVIGTGLDKKADVKVIGAIQAIDFKGYTYNNINIDGIYRDEAFTGGFHIKDPNLDLAFNGTVDFSDKKPTFDFEADISHAMLSKINLTGRDSMPELNTYIKVQMTDTDPDKMFGSLTVSGFRYSEGERELDIDTLTISLDWLTDGRRHIQIRSDILDAEASGNFSFNDFPRIYRSLMKNYLPGKLITNGPESTEMANIEFDVRIKDIDDILGVFAKKISIPEQAFVRGKYNLQPLMVNVDAGTPLISVGSIEIEGWAFHASASEGPLSITTSASFVNLSDSVHIDNIKLTSLVQNDSLAYSLKWANNNMKIRNSGDIHGILVSDTSSFSLLVSGGQMFINDSLWTMGTRNRVVFDTAGYIVSNISFMSRQKSITVDGSVLKHSSSSLKLTFNNIDLSEFDPLLNPRKVDFDGVLTGHIYLNDLSTAPHFLSDLSIRNFGFNHDQLGDAHIKSVWDHEKRAAKLDLDIVYVGSEGVRKPVTIKGMVYPQSDTENLDLTVDLVNFKVRTIERYLESFTSSFSGLASGSIKVNGTFKQPELSGKLKLMRTFLKVDYLNTMYSFADEIHLTPNSISFNNVVMNDNNDNDLVNSRATVTAMIKHKNFKDWRYDINIKPNQFTLLNTNSIMSEQYYGKAIVTGNIDIQGVPGSVQINVKAKTEKGTILYIPLNSSEEVSSRSFISFVSAQPEGEKVEEEVAPEISLAGIRLLFELEATPDAEIQIILDEKIGDIIKTRGSGNITMTIDTKGDFDMYGEYTVSDGDYLFTLQNVINKRFRIDRGGTLRWSGSPYDADLDLNAVYKTKAPLYDLVSRYTDSEVYKKRQPVECHIAIKGKLMSPEVAFDIQVPGADETTKEYIKSALYLSGNEVNQLEMNKQFMGLLVVGRFFPPGEGIGSTLVSQSTESTESTSLELLSNQLSNWLSQISKDFDFGVNYRAGDAITNQELELALSTQLLDDRLSIDGNVGIGGGVASGTPSAGQQNTSNIVGDVNVEYKITPRFRIKAFNKSNQHDYLRQNAPYTQGVGIFWRKEFDHWPQLFRRDKAVPAAVN